MKNRKHFQENENSAFETHRRLGNSIALVPRIWQLRICGCLAYLPPDVASYIIDNYIFIGQDENELGSQYEFSHPYFLAKKGFILLSSQLWRRRPIEKAMVIAHEVAHAIIHDKYVRDKRSVFEKRLEMEKEANRLAIKWLEKRYNRERLQRICSCQY